MENPKRIAVIYHRYHPLFACMGLGASIFAPIYNLEFYILHVSVPILSLFSLRLIFFSKTSDCKKRQMPSIQISEKKYYFLIRCYNTKVKIDHVALAMKSCTCSLFTYWGVMQHFSFEFLVCVQETS